MKGNFHVRFGGGRLEKEPQGHLVSRLPNYGGSGPAQLSLALLADALGDDERAVSLHQPFKWEVVAKLPARESWILTDEEIRDIAQRIEAREAAERRQPGGS